MVYVEEEEAEAVDMAAAAEEEEATAEDTAAVSGFATLAVDQTMLVVWRQNVVVVPITFLLSSIALFGTDLVRRSPLRS